MSDTLLLLVVGAPLFALWVYAVGEVIRRADLPAARQFAWVVALVLVPVLGLAAYIVVRPTRALYRERPVTGNSVAETVVRAAERRQRGELTDGEYLAEVTSIASLK